MKFGLRGLTLGGVVAAAAMANLAHAGPMTVDFEAVTLGQAVGTTYAGLSFTGDNEVKDDTLFSASPFPPSVKFLVSRTGFVVDVLDSSATPFNSLYFDYFGAMDVTIVDTAGTKTTLKIDLSLTPDWQMLAAPVLLDKSTRIDYVEFARGGTTSFGQMAIDNLTFDLQPGSTTPPTPNPVPEPAGYALAALALLGVGLMTRRRG